MHLFFDTFSSQMPIVHRRTWNMETAHPILTRAMQACGALLVKNDKAARFLAESVEGIRGVVGDEFVRILSFSLAVLIVPRREARPNTKTT